MEYDSLQMLQKYCYATTGHQCPKLLAGFNYLLALEKALYCFSLHKFVTSDDS